MNSVKAKKLYEKELQNSRVKPMSSFYSFPQKINKLIAIDKKLTSFEYDFIHSIKFIKQNLLSFKQKAFINRVFDKFFYKR